MRAWGFCLMMAGILAAPKAFAMNQSFAQNNKAWCAVHRNEDQFSRDNCADAAWCATHRNDDRHARIVCDPFRSRANLRMPAPSLTPASLGTSGNLTESEKRSACFEAMAYDAPDSALRSWCSMVQGVPRRDMTREMGSALLPNGMKDARLALRAKINFGWLPEMIVKIGLQSAKNGTISISTARLNGPRRTLTASLEDAEIGQIVAAMDRSRFWQLPEEGGHQGVVDGEMASIEVSVSGLRHHVTDAIGPPDAVDLSILANAITSIVSARWRDI